MSNFALYLIGFSVVIGGLVLAGLQLKIAPVWLAIGALILLGIGMLTGVSRTRTRERPPTEQ